MSTDTFEAKTKRINEAKTVAELIDLHKEFRSKKGAKADYDEMAKKTAEELKAVLNKLIAPKKGQIVIPTRESQIKKPFNIILIESYDAYEIEQLDKALIVIQTAIDKKLKNEATKHREAAKAANAKADEYESRLNKK